MKKVYKTGRLTNDEQDFIAENQSTMSIQDISDRIGRREITVRKFLKTTLPEKKMRRNLESMKKEAFWDQLQSEFNQHELELFADEYRGFVHQFRGEILHSEQIQILDSIRLGILAGRKLREEKKLRDEIDEYEKLLFTERAGGFPDEKLVDDYEHELIQRRQVVDGISKQYKELIEQKTRSLEKLKATRGQREDITTSAFKTSFKEWMKRLIEDSQFRESVGLYMEKFRIAADKEYDRLVKTHTYMDGNQDIPILTAESIERNAEIERDD